MPTATSKQSFKPPATVSRAAERALAERAEKPPSQRGMTPVGLARARDLASGRKVSMATIKRMKAYFDRHQVDKKGSTWNAYGKGRQAWDGWGGDAGYAWAKGLVRRQGDLSNRSSGGLREGQFVNWKSSGGTARGKIEHVMKKGVLGVPDSKFKIEAKPDDPAVLIRIYRKKADKWEETPTLVGHRALTLQKIDSLRNASAILSNTGRSFVSDEQRKAAFAAMGRGGGSSGYRQSRGVDERARQRVRDRADQHNQDRDLAWANEPQQPDIDWAATLADGAKGLSSGLLPGDLLLDAVIDEVGRNIGESALSPGAAALARAGLAAGALLAPSLASKLQKARKIAINDPGYALQTPPSYLPKLTGRPDAADREFAQYLDDFKFDSPNTPVRPDAADLKFNEYLDGFKFDQPKSPRSDRLYHGGNIEAHNHDVFSRDYTQVSDRAIAADIHARSRRIDAAEKSGWRRDFVEKMRSENHHLQSILDQRSMQPMRNSRGFVSEEQRKAVFASMGRGGGGGRGRSSGGGSRQRGQKNKPTPPLTPAALRDKLMSAIRGAGQLPSPTEYLDQLSGEAKGREDFFRAAAGLSPIAAGGVVIDDIMKSQSPGDLALAGAGALLLPLGVNPASRLTRISQKPFSHDDYLPKQRDLSLSEATQWLRGKADEFRPGGDISDKLADKLMEYTPESLDQLKAAFSNQANYQDRSVYEALDIARRAKDMTRPFTTTPREAIRRQYPTDKAFDRTIDKARDYQEKNPQYRYLQDLSDESLDKKTRVDWKTGLADEATEGVYWPDPGDEYASLGAHTAYNAIKTGKNDDLVRYLAHEMRHGTQNTGNKLVPIMDYHDRVGTPYELLPYEIEVRVAESKPLLRPITGKDTFNSPTWYKVVREQPEAWGAIPDDIRRALQQPRSGKLYPGLLGLPVAAGVGAAATYENRSAVIANMGGKREMTDEQRRAMFAAMGGGGGGARGGGSGGGKGSSAQVKGDNPSVLKAAWDGFWEGALGGAAIAANALTFGAVPALQRAADAYTGPGAEFSKGAATFGREAGMLAAGLGVAGKVATGLGLAGKGSKASQVVKGLGVTAGGFGTQSLIKDVRADNPTMNPIADKALGAVQTAAGYVGSMGLVAAGLGAGGAALSKIPMSGKLSTAAKLALKSDKISLTDKGRISALGRAQQTVKGVDKYIGAGKVKLKKNLSPGTRKGLRALNEGYSKLADFTGASIKDLGGVPKAAGKLKTANKLAGRAKDQMSQGTAIKTAGQMKSNALNSQARSQLARANAENAAGNYKAAGILRTDAMSKSYQAQQGLASSSANAKKLQDAARNTQLRSDKLRKGAKESLAKAGYVAGGMGAITARDEIVVRDYQRKQTDAIRRGESIDVPGYLPRSNMGTLAAAAMGTLGNPIEKLFRPGIERNLAQQGIYRANYNAIKDAQARGEMSSRDADKALKDLADRKPFKSEGNTMWQFAPAAAGYLNWKIGDAIEKAKRTVTAPVTRVVDGDTLAVDYLFPGQDISKRGEVRFLDLNTPETKHPTRGVEYFGPEASARMNELIKPGQYVRVVEDSNPSAQGLGRWGRQLGYVETLPKPFDNLLRIPVVGKYIPAMDVNKKMIAEGYGDIAYRYLSGRTDRAQTYDKVRTAAQEAGIGIWSPEGRANLDWLGSEQTVSDRQAARFERETGKPMPDAWLQPYMTVGGSGLMVTGNTGVFQQMPRSGNALVRAWNAALAVGGALEYNERASRTYDYETKRPGGLLSDYERSMEEMLYGR